MQQLAQRDRSGLVHGGPHDHLHRFQIQPTGLVLFLKYQPEECAYFPLDFLADGFRSFFSAA